MEPGDSETIFQTIIKIPGLSHIADDIFLLLDVKTLIRCVEVCCLWKWYIVENRLLRRNILGPKKHKSCFSSAPEGSHNRQLLKRLLGLKFAPKQNEDIDTEEEFGAFKRFVNLIDPSNRERRIKDCQLPKVKFLGRDRIVRDVKPVGDRLVFASGTELHVVDREPQFFSERIQTPTKKSSAVTHSSEFRHIVHRIMNGHRRDVSCLDVVKGRPNIVASGAKDRKLVIWCMESGKILDYVNDAHERLVTCVKFLQESNTTRFVNKDKSWSIVLFTSSRDRRVKMWKLEFDDNRSKSYIISLEQTIEGHVHSVWDIDCTLDYLVAGSADKTIRVWKNRFCKDEALILENDSLLQYCGMASPMYNQHCQFENEGTGVRQLIILKRFPTLVLSGDLLGDLNMWNIKTKSLQYSVPEPCATQGHRQSLFRIAGAVVGISQTQSTGTIAVAFGSDRVDLFSTIDAYNELKLLRTIDFNIAAFNKFPQRSDHHRYVRGVLLTKTELYICGMSENYGLLLFDFWK